MNFFAAAIKDTFRARVIRKVRRGQLYGYRQFRDTHYFFDDILVIGVTRNL